ncbi:MAG: hypothetical protein WC906_03105 [Parcubacteria group bacterium]|jgi:hypothetical protein
MKTIEDSIFKNEQVIFPDLEKRFREAQEDLAEYRIDIERFRKLYGDEAVDRDMSTVNHIKEKFLKTRTPEDVEAKKLAIIFESVFNKHAELSNWLGENAALIPTSEYDDIINGVDAIAEFSEEEKNPHHLGLGVDITYSVHLKKKFQKIKEKINSGKLSEIKYFQSSNMDFTGQLSQIPGVVISASRETVKELVEFMEGKKNKELGEHFIQFQVLEEIIQQLGVFKEYAGKVGKMDIVRKFEMTEKIIVEIYEKKKEEAKDTGKRDGSMEILTRQLESVFNE